MSNLAFTARLPLARLTRAPRALLPALAWVALALGSAVVLRRSASSASVDAVQLVFGPLVLPLLAFAIVGAVVGGDGLARSTRPFVAFGAPPLEVALATVGIATLATALAASILGLVVALVAHGSGHGGGSANVSLARDALATFWVSGLGGAAYGALFSLGASFGKRGVGRPVVLALDWILGAGTGAASFLAPRPHVRSLLGGDAVMTFAGHDSALVLVLLVALFGALAVWRARASAA